LDLAEAIEPLAEVLDDRDQLALSCSLREIASYIRSAGRTISTMPPEPAKCK